MDQAYRRVNGLWLSDLRDVELVDLLIKSVRGNDLAFVKECKYTLGVNGCLQICAVEKMRRIAWKNRARIEEMEAARAASKITIAEAASHHKRMLPRRRVKSTEEGDGDGEGEAQVGGESEGFGF